jgi:hypothetical protein
MRDHGRVACAIWASEDFAALSDLGKLFMLYLLTNAHSNMVGVFRLTNGTASDDLGWGTDRVLDGFGELHRMDIATRCERTKLVVIHKYLKWNPVKGPQQRIGLVKAVKTMPRGAAISERVWAVICEHVQGLDDKQVLEIKTHLDPKEDCRTLPLPLGMPRVPIEVAVAVAVSGAVAGGKAGEGAAPPSPPAVGERSLAAKAAEAYAVAFNARYSVNATFNPKVRGLFANLVTRLGAAAPEVAQFYLSSERKVYVDSKHCVDLLVRDAESLHTEFQRAAANALGTLGKWWENRRGILGRGEELGVKPVDGETFGMFTARVFIAAGDGPWLAKVDALIAGYMQQLRSTAREAAA